MAPEAAVGVAGPNAVVLYSTAGTFDLLPTSAHAVLGEFVVAGANHGRRVYQRKRKAGGRALPELSLFFWDARDGKELSGWWVGERVGGGKVWARNESTASEPPKNGWKCPVDGLAQEHVLCEAKDADEDEMDEEWEGAGEGNQQKRSFPAALPTPQRPAKVQTLVLASKLEGDAVGDVKKLIGEYVQQGMNHGKKTFFKQGTDDEEVDDPPVWLYYWDGRDGFESSGWWLGPTIGGREVHGWAAQHSSIPASRGWRIPHKAALVRHDVTLLPKAPDEDREIDGDERLEKARAMVLDAERQAEKAVKTAKSVLAGKGGLLEESAHAVHELLVARLQTLSDAGVSLARHVRAAKRQGASEELEGELQLLQERLDTATGRVEEELEKAKDVVGKVERELAERQGSKAIEETLPELMELVARAELSAESADDPESAGVVRQLLRDATPRVSQALEAAQPFAPEARKSALAELTALKARCEAVERRLDTPPSDVSLSDGRVPGAVVLQDGDDESEPGDLGMMALAVEAPEDGCGSIASDDDVAIPGLGDDGSGDEADAASRLLLGASGREVARKRPAEVPDPDDAWFSMPAKKQEVSKANESTNGVDDGSLLVALEALDRAEVAVEALVESIGEADWWTSRIELRGAQRAQRQVDAAQVAVEAADVAVAEARGRFEAEVRRLSSQMLPGGPQKATFGELAIARSRLADIQQRLLPFRRLKAAFAAQLRASEQLEEFAGLLAEASRAELEETRTALEQSEFMPQRAKDDSFPGGGLTEALEERRAELLERCFATIEGFAERQLVRKQRQQQSKGETLLERARVVVEKAEVWLPKLAAAEGPWADGREILGAGDASFVLEEAAKVALRAENAARGAQTAVLEVLAEARRLKEAVGAIEGLEVLQARADAVAARAAQLKADTVDRQSKSQMRDVVQAVVAAEVAVRGISGAAELLAQDNLEGDAAPSGLTVACLTILALEPEASQACAAARLSLSVRQGDPRDVEGSAFRTMLGRLSARQAAAVTQLEDLVTAAGEAEGNWRRLRDQKAALIELEAKVDEAELVNLPLGDESEPSEEVEDERVAAVLRASQALATWRAAAEVHAQSPHGALKVAIGRVLTRSDASKRRLQEVEALGRHWRERAMCRIFLREASDTIDKLEISFSKSDDVEEPFLKGLEAAGMEASEAEQALEACEAVVAECGGLLGDAQAMLSARRREVLSFRCVDAEFRTSISKQLEERATRAAEVAKRLGQFRREAQSRRRALESGRRVGFGAAAAAAQRPEAEAEDI